MKNNIDLKKLIIAFTIGSIFLGILITINFTPIPQPEEVIVDEVIPVEQVVEVKQPQKTSDTVSMIMGLNSKVDKQVAEIIANAVEKYSKKYSLSIPLVLALMNKESSFRPIVTSKANCVGLMQINPKMHPEKVKGYKHSELYHIDVNVSIGCQILRQYLDKKKTIKGALQSYLGAHNNSYMMDILSTCVELGIKN
jgi:soluble lytic murein transglycosylase-like protein